MTVINTNVAANNTYRMMSIASEEKASSMEKLSSGLRINRAADDAAGLSIAEGLRAQSNGLEVAARNIADAVSLVQTAEGGLSAAGDILQRIRDLAVQAGNDTNNAEARGAIATEVTALTAELTRMSESIKFNNNDLLNAPAPSDATLTAAAAAEAAKAALAAADEETTPADLLALQEGVTEANEALKTARDADAAAGLGANTFNFQVGANGSKTDTSNDQISLSIKTNLATIATSIDALDFTSAAGAAAAITALDGHIGDVSAERSNLGAVQNRLEHTLKHVNVTQENLTNAESNIRDVDMAKEIVKQSAASIKEQASQAMLAQANQASQNVLQLLR
ncbi:flagellin [Cellulosimicrobium funkei]|nr:flagellin [Cellulosimicrobium funkei]